MDNSNLNIPQDKLDGMLRLASQKLGTSPQQLKQQLQNGNFDALKGNAALNSILNDPKKMQQMLQNPQIQSLLRNLNGK